MIYINGRFLEQSMTGVQRFASELVYRLSELRNDITILVSNKSNIKYATNDLNIIEVAGGAGHYWEQVTLPKYLKTLNNPLLLNLCNSAPIFYRNKISTHHDITYIKYPESYSWKFRLFYKNFTPLFLKTSHAVITVSDCSRKDISTFYNIDDQKIYVIHNAVSENFKQLVSNQNEADNSLFALAVSSPNYHKNFARMIEAYVKSEANYKLKIIGSASSVFNSVESQNILENEKVEFVGRVSDEELIDLYQKAQFFIFPSLYEGFGIPPLEAQQCGCPVISSDAASLPEVLQESALYFNPLDVSDITDKINIIYSNKKIKLDLVEKGLKNTTRFSWMKSAENLNILINKYAE